MGLFSKKIDPQVIGELLSDLTKRLCTYGHTEDVIKKMQFSKIEADRFRFCLFFYNISSAIFWVNWSRNPYSHKILDFMLEYIYDTMRKDNRAIRVGDFILDKNEMKLLDLESDGDTKTTYYSIFDSLYEKRVGQFTEAITEQIGFALTQATESEKEKLYSMDPVPLDRDPVGKLLIRIGHTLIETNTTEKEKLYSMDPVGKLFIRIFTGGDSKNHPQLWFAVSGSLFLSNYRNIISNSIGEVLKGNTFGYEK